MTSSPPTARTAVPAPVQGAPGLAPRTMLTVLQTTHQHADAKAGILSAVQAALVGTAGAWSEAALDGWRRGGPVGALAGVLLVLFACGLFGGAASLALAIRPRVWRPTGPNDYSFVWLAAASDPSPPTNAAEDERQLHAMIRFLSDVALRKYRCVTTAVVCTAVMGTTAGFCLLLRPLLG
ncbi:MULTISPECIES: Pycsar system effector family protein [unclassified Streptomyces]|uniref:Pycsar system effector family protein n=1 Tax=unclassified Streptomyces TaxID=2593676 RepID=UPI002E27DC34|nr:Pycsar system effector family protein [Streptomyces sp. NBC_01439]